MQVGFRSTSLSLPDELFNTIEADRKKRFRSRSEWFREAAQLYLVMSRPAYKPTAAERREIEAGRAEGARGEYTEVSSSQQIRDALGLKD